MVAIKFASINDLVFRRIMSSSGKFCVLMRKGNRLVFKSDTTLDAVTNQHQSRDDITSKCTVIFHGRQLISCLFKSNKRPIG